MPANTNFTTRPKRTERILSNRYRTSLSEIFGKNEELNRHLDNVTSISDEVLQARRFDWHGSHLEREQITLMVRLSKVLNTLDDENRQLDDILTQNTILNHDILERIDNILNRFEYHELFERVLINIIQKLNSVNSRLKPESRSRDTVELLENLKDHERLYTVESERIIHRKVVSGETGCGITHEDQPEDSEDVELF